VVSVVIPWREGCPHREAALRWLQDRLHYPWTTAECLGEWNKGLAVMPAVRLNKHVEVIVMHDADVWCRNLRTAVLAVVSGAAEWAVPHQVVRRLDQVSTSRVLGGEEPNDRMSLDEQPYDGMLGGGIVVAHRDTILDTPIDDRFRGWGQEDQSWGMALRTLHGAPWRGDADLYHLWHPPAERWTRHRGSPENWKLQVQYNDAKFKGPEAMRQLLGRIP
jgi:hypothetical protein